MYDVAVQIFLIREEIIRGFQTLKKPCKQKTVIDQMFNEKGDPDKRTSESYIWDNRNSILMTPKTTDGDICVTFVFNPKHANID